MGLVAACIQGTGRLNLHRAGILWGCGVHPTLQDVHGQYGLCACHLQERMKLCYQELAQS